MTDFPYMEQRRDWFEALRRKDPLTAGKAMPPCQKCGKPSPRPICVECIGLNPDSLAEWVTMEKEITYKKVDQLKDVVEQLFASEMVAGEHIVDVAVRLLKQYHASMVGR